LALSSADYSARSPPKGLCKTPPEQGTDDSHSCGEAERVRELQAGILLDVSAGERHHK
jgi:hypothetical protein